MWAVLAAQHTQQGVVVGGGVGGMGVSQLIATLEHIASLRFGINTNISR